MNWALLIIAGLFEVAFAFCLGKAKETTGNEMYLWFVGFFSCTSHQYDIIGKSNTNVTYRNSLRSLDRYWSCRNRTGRHICIQRTGNLLTYSFYQHINRLYNRLKGSIALIPLCTSYQSVNNILRLSMYL